MSKDVKKTEDERRKRASALIQEEYRTSWDFFEKMQGKKAETFETACDNTILIPVNTPLGKK